MRRFAILTAAALMTAALAIPVLAQEDQGQTVTVSTRINQGELIDLDFEGGTLTEFIASLREAAGEHVVNIIVPTRAKQLPVPALQLRKIDLYTALRAAEPAGLVRVDGDYLKWSADRLAGEGAPVYKIVLRVISGAHPGQQGSTSQPGPQKHTAVHSITELTTGSKAMSADDVLSAIQAALAIEGADDETTIRYHEETGLVFARVTKDLGRMIESTIMNLRVSRDAKQRSEERNAVDAMLRRMNVDSIESAATRLAHYEELRQENILLKVQVAALNEQITKMRAGVQ